jgi:hypothetical protein
MLKIGFGKSVKPRTFDYVPRFFDPAKEELQDKIRKYEKAEHQEDDLINLKNRIRTGMRMKHNGDASSRAARVTKSNIRLLFIIIVLGMACYLLMSSNKIISLIEAFSK